jgi:hypothetical protein
MPISAASLQDEAANAGCRVPSGVRTEKINEFNENASIGAEGRFGDASMLSHPPLERHNASWNLLRATEREFSQRSPAKKLDEMPHARYGSLVSPGIGMGQQTDTVGKMSRKSSYQRLVEA